MRVLLTGGTGFLGAHIARVLVRRGYTVRMLVRARSRFDRLADLPCETVLGDLCERTTLRRALYGVDAVVHAAGNISLRLQDSDAVYRDNVDGTRNLMEEAVEATEGRRRMRVVYTSSTAAVGTTASPQTVNERHPWGGDNADLPYVASKRHAEDVALSYVNRGLDVVALCPGFLLGPGGDAHNCTGLVLRYLRGQRLASIDGGLSLCDARDVAEVHGAALGQGAVGERYILAGHNLSNQELFAQLRELTGLPHPPHLAPRMALALATVSELAAKLGGRSWSHFNRPMVRYAMRYAYYDSDEARRAFGYQPRPRRDVLRDTVADFLARGHATARTPQLRILAQARGAQTVRAA